MPDGKHFAICRDQNRTRELKGSVHVTVLLNFFDELQRKVLVGK